MSWFSFMSYSKFIHDPIPLKFHTSDLIDMSSVLDVDFAVSSASTFNPFN